MEDLEVRARVGYRRCKECNYAQPIFDVEVLGTDVSKIAASVGIEVLIGFGTASLLYLLLKESE